jgi:DNA-binding NarL/FixJ family response regulator
MVTQRSGIRVLLVDDYRMLREGLRSCLESVSTIEVVGEACNGEEAMRCVEKLQPQVVVMDINMPQMDGVTATRLMTGQYPDVAVVGLSVSEDQYHKAAMEKAGALGVLTKGKHGMDELCREIEKAAATMLFMSQARRKTELLN